MLVSVLQLLGICFERILESDKQKKIFPPTSLKLLYLSCTLNMAESNEIKNIKLTLKTPKEKKDVEVSEEASVKEVSFSFLILL